MLSVDDVRKKREVTNQVYIAHLFELEKKELQLLQGHRRGSSNSSSYSNKDLQFTVKSRLKPISYDHYSGMSLNKATLL